MVRLQALQFIVPSEEPHLQGIQPMVDATPAKSQSDWIRQSVGEFRQCIRSLAMTKP